MSHRNQQIEAIAEQRRLLEARIAARRQRVGGHDHGDIGMVGDEKVEALLGVGFDDRDLGARESLHHRQSSRWKQRGRGSGEAAQAQPSGARIQTRAEAVELTPDLLPPGEELLRAFEEELTGASEDEAASARFDDAHAEILRQASELVRYGRRSVSEAVCRLGEGADFGKDPKDVETRIDHAIVLHVSDEEDSLFFSKPLADTGGRSTDSRAAVGEGAGTRRGRDITTRWWTN